ncbi:histidine phosphatase family protein [Streptomyces sp. ITFR-16]|uniref:histidine phosphatase family protein n=1 Tax=Streptomyces sp. ITFR-16 TaxID=3075198 RepID=UPI00288B8B63|nr:histidine phosphatase family protein [Streptomyces sp. ITFR-16]WNI24915.1 histidine phosphatase family protein [Streptomyces sp. ITFR-16]
MTLFYVVQHAEKEQQPGDQGLTELGRSQARRTAQWLSRRGLRTLVSSPLRRARETAQAIVAETGLELRVDARLLERTNWEEGCSREEFMADWAASVRDRDHTPRTGVSSREAGARFRALLLDYASVPGPVAVTTHGGATVDLLRTLLGDEALSPKLLHEGVPSCAVTTIEGLTVLDIASTEHLDPGGRPGGEAWRPVRRRP